jgi:Arc/MetJ-type ribon-helix-helix transcriptional regulator
VFGVARFKTGNKYITIKIPEGLTKLIDEMISAKNSTYTSRTDVIKDAVRLLYREKKVE